MSAENILPDPTFLLTQESQARFGMNYDQRTAERRISIPAFAPVQPDRRSTADRRGLHVVENDEFDGVDATNVSFEHPRLHAVADVVDISAPNEATTQSLFERLAEDSAGPLTPYLIVARPIAGEKKSPVSKYECYATDDETEILDARRLVANRYLQLGFIGPDDIDNDGTMNETADPYAKNATYYILKDPEENNIVATSRRIHYDPELGEKSFPLWEHKDELNPDMVARVEELGIENAVEISSLVRNPEYKTDKWITMKLYRQMFQDAWDAGVGGEEVFLMACKPKLFSTFKKIFDGSMQRMGENLEYPGEEVVPAMFELKDGSVNLIRQATEPLRRNRNAIIHRTVVRYMMNGMNYDNLDVSIRNAMNEGGYEDILRQIGIQEPESGFADKLKKRKPEIIAAAGLIGYTALRTVGVAEGISPESDVDWRVFLGIELATTPTYVMGMGDVVRSTIKPESYTRRQRIQAMLLGGGSFLAPYAYVVAEGEGTPAAAWAGVGAFAAVSGVSVFRQVRSAAKARKNAIDENPVQD